MLLIPLVLFSRQCSICACGSSDEENEKVVDVNRPRQLRKSSDIRSKYANIDEISSTKKFTQQLLKKTKQRSLINRVRSKSLGDRPTPVVTRKSRETINQLNDQPKSPPKSQSDTVEDQVLTEKEPLGNLIHI